jgi:lipopolysaccharide biosynthesis regulator YciM
MAAKLEKSGTGSFATRIAHHWCEVALDADERGQAAEAEDALRRAREIAPHAARPLVLGGQRMARAGRHAHALELWNELRRRNPAAFLLVARDYAKSAQACGQSEAALAALKSLYERQPSIDLLHAIALLDPSPEVARQRLADHLAAQPTLSAALDVLQLPQQAWSAEALAGVRQAVARAAKPMQRYRCAACGFEAQHYFWQCPACLSWDSYPPARIEEL